MDKLRDEQLKRAIRKLGIKWPGDGDYGFGTEVYIGGSHRVVRLVEPLDNIGQFKTDCGGTYTERRVGTVITQDFRPGPKGTRAEPETKARRVRQMVIDYMMKRKVPPTILHISFDDLMDMMREEPSLAQSGEVGLDIALVPRGQPMSVDRRCA